MSTTIRETIEAKPGQDIRSQAGTPTWEMAHLYPAQGTWSEQEYLRLDIGRQVEYTHGVLEFLPMPTLSHQDIVRYLLQRLDAHVRKENLGRVYFAPCPVRIGKGKYREPGLFFLKHERIGDRKTPPDGADLIVEVVSEGEENRRRDLVEKRREYAEAGIPEYWVVDPQYRRIIVFVLEGETYRVHGEFGPGQRAASVLLPGFEVSVEETLAAGEK